MARAGAAGGDAAGPRRSALLQERSRNTRRELVRVAFSMWGERGFDRGIEETTVEEIARAAGVTKATFYFHFAHKEDILLELGWTTADELSSAAELDMTRGRPAAEIVSALMSALARRIERAPRAAVRRGTAELIRVIHKDRSAGMPWPNPFTAVAAYGIERGELPPAADPDELGALLRALTMDSVLRWAEDGEGELARALRFNADVVMAGIGSVFATADAGADLDAASVAGDPFVATPGPD